MNTTIKIILQLVLLSIMLPNCTFRKSSKENISTTPSHTANISMPINVTLPKDQRINLAVDIPQGYKCLQNNLNNAMLEFVPATDLDAYIWSEIITTMVYGGKRIQSKSFVTSIKNYILQIDPTAITYIFKDKSALHFTSTRKFEKTWLVKDLDIISVLKNLGPDALSISLATLQMILEKQKIKNIKATLIDQKIIAGIGNEYADEILYQAAIDPHHACKNLSPAQIKKLHTSMLQVLKHAVQLRVKASHAVTESESPLAGDFAPQYLQYHRHTDMNCPKNSDHELKKTKIAGRTTYYCPTEQK